MKISKELNTNIWFRLLIFILLVFLLLSIMIKYKSVCDWGGTFREPVSLKTFIDDWIPFNVYIIYPYVLAVWYPIFVGVLYAVNKSINVMHLISFYFGDILLWLSCYAIYLIFPTTAKDVMITSFNPSILSLEMFNTLQFLYNESTPLGACPSLHVAPMVFMSISLYKHWRSLFWPFLPLAFLASIGTVLLKFHVFADVLGGMAMGIFGYYIFYEKIALKYLNSFFLHTEDID
jgi:membrane-associated phospholipid phosphatase